MPGQPNATGEAVTRIAVDVTFLRMDRRPDTPPPALPPGFSLAHLRRPTVGFYRYLLHAVGHDYCWWLRSVDSDQTIATLLRHPRVAVFVLYADGEPAGFCELDGRGDGVCNIAYFGLLPHMVGRRIGGTFLRVAVAAAWSTNPKLVTVNTCTADHPRALPAYLKAGFRPFRTVEEIWPIPDRLGLPIPDHLRV